MKLELTEKSKQDVEEEKQQRHEKREEKKVKKLVSRMNACQAVLQSDCSKKTVPKAVRMKKAIIQILHEALKQIQSLPETKAVNEIIHQLHKESILIENVQKSEMPSHPVGVISCEFAGVKFKRNFSSGQDYIKYKNEEVVQGY